MRITLVLLVLFFVAGCGSGSSAPSTEPATAASPSAPAATPPATGVFTDSPVAGLHYETPGFGGVTNAAGEFQYRPGERITFSLGSVVFGTIVASDVVTPFDLVGANDLDDATVKGVRNQVTNMVTFLQSLDRDHDPGNGIDLGTLDAEIKDLRVDFSVDVATFQQGTYRTAVNRHAGRLRSPREALNHLLRNLGQSSVVRVPAQDRTDVDGDGAFDVFVDYKYDSNARPVLISVTRDGAVIGTTEIVYDDHGPVSIETMTSIGTVVEELQYDADFGLLKREVFVDGVLVQEFERQFDEVGNLIRSVDKINEAGVPQNFYSQHFRYKPALEPVIFGVAGASDLIRPSLSELDLDVIKLFLNSFRQRETVTTYTYAASGNVENIEVTMERGGVTSNQVAVYENGRPVHSYIQANGTTIQDWQLNYDEEGNLESCRQTGLGLNRIIDDPVSNLALQPRPTSFFCWPEDEFQIETDSTGRVVRVTVAGSEFQPGYESTITYDGNRLVEYHVEAMTSGGKTDTRHLFSYDEIGNLIEERTLSFDVLVFHWVRELIELTVSELPPDQD